MRQLRLIDICVVLEEAYAFVNHTSNNPGVMTMVSPTTHLVVPFPMGQGDYLSETVLAHILGDEPIDLEDLIQRIAARGGLQND